MTARLLLLCLVLAAPGPAAALDWSAPERGQIAALSLDRLPAVPPDPTNRHADDQRAAALGRALFFDPRLSANGRLSCATCHQPDLQFTDGLPRSRGLGALRRNAPSLLTAAWQRWQFWDGRADSLWMQATGPLTDADELGLSPARLHVLLTAHHGPGYEAVFGPLQGQDDARVLVNTGKALAAYVRTLRPRPSRFDAFASALTRPGHSDALDSREQRGLKVFLGKGQCLRCHNGPLLSNGGFHNTGLGALPPWPVDTGRARGASELLASAYSCRGRYSDAPDRCPHLDFLRAGSEARGAFRVPSLRGVALTAPYMHDGRFATLAEVIEHYDRAPRVPDVAGHSELFPLALTPGERADLEAFLRALSPVTPGGL